MKILITGISGKLGRRATMHLLEHGHEVIGLDRRPWRDAPEGVEIHQTDVRKRPAEEVFRNRRPDAVIHMATVTHLMQRSPDRFRINLQGTRAIFNHSERYGVKQVVVVGRHTYYGAAPDSPLYHTEDEPPLAIHIFPELADLVASDLYAGNAIWRFPKIQTSVLRCCYSLGPSGHGTLAGFISGEKVPTVMGFDPLFHLMHEEDVAEAIVLAVEKSLRGVFNVSGPQPVPFSVVIRETGGTPLPIPEPLFHFTSRRLGLPKLPKGAIEHLKYPIVIDSSAFRAATGFTPKYDEDQSMAAFRDRSFDSSSR